MTRNIDDKVLVEAYIGVLNPELVS